MWLKLGYWINQFKQLVFQLVIQLESSLCKAGARENAIKNRSYCTDQYEIYMIVNNLARKQSISSTFQLSSALHLL